MRIRPLCRASTCATLFFVAVTSSDALVLRAFNATTHLRMNGFPATPTVNPMFLNAGGSPATLLDLSGVGWSVQDTTKQLTLVSRRHFVGANHFRPAVGSMVRFLASDNTLFTVTIAKISTIPNADNSPSDVYLGEFMTDLPASAAVLPMPYLNLATEAAFMGEALVVAGQAARGGRGTIGTVSDFGGDPITGGAGITTRAITFSYGPFGSVDDCHAEGGDSGSPSFAVRSGKAALVGTHTAVLSATGTVTTYDTLVPHYAPVIDLLMESTGFHMRKITPAATLLSAAGTATTPIVRAAKPFTYRFTISNGTAAADNVVANFTLPPGLSISSVSANGWYDNGTNSIRRGGLDTSGSTQVEITFAAAPSPGPIQIGIDLKSDGSALQSFQFPLTVLPSFENWASGLTGPSPAADDDLDGISNLVEYASGGDPRVNSQFFPGTVELLQPVIGNNLKLGFIRRTDASDRGLSYRLERSLDLATGSWLPLEGVSISPVANPAPGFEKVEATLPNTGEKKAFYRIRIELAE